VTTKRRVKMKLVLDKSTIKALKKVKKLSGASLDDVVNVILACEIIRRGS